ncbi:hypothetical protein BaRGS_00037700 [Batillaria attramentaria]|uniref:Uncharacterized protein n=1 Tax=Batillaria attramentaria TaxID=370345 RepID=A0ABD0J853_9CAEN
MAAGVTSTPRPLLHTSNSLTTEEQPATQRADEHYDETAVVVGVTTAFVAVLIVVAIIYERRKISKKPTKQTYERHSSAPQDQRRQGFDNVCISHDNETAIVAMTTDTDKNPYEHLTPPEDNQEYQHLQPQAVAKQYAMTQTTSADTEHGSMTQITSDYAALSSKP